MSVHMGSRPLEIRRRVVEDGPMQPLRADSSDLIQSNPSWTATGGGDIGLAAPTITQVDGESGIVGTVGSGATTRGRRLSNEDRMVVGPDWFLVADGVGGQAGGERAAEIVEATFRAAPAPLTVDDVVLAVETANSAVRQHAGNIDAASTVVGATCVGRRLVVFHVGDSRCYQLQAGALHLLTEDHTLDAELMRADRPTAGRVTQRLRNVLTRAIGIEDAVNPSIGVFAASTSRLLLCSDGLSNELDAPTIGRVLVGITNPAEAAQRLIALAANASDNATAVVVDIVCDNVAQPT